jgi:hypothetical protein
MMADPWLQRLYEDAVEDYDRVLLSPERTLSDLCRAYEARLEAFTQLMLSGENE